MLYNIYIGVYFVNDAFQYIHPLKYFHLFYQIMVDLLYA